VRNVGDGGEDLSAGERMGLLAKTAALGKAGADEDLAKSTDGMDP